MQLSTFLGSSSSGRLSCCSSSIRRMEESAANSLFRRNTAAILVLLLCLLSVEDTQCDHAGSSNDESRSGLNNGATKRSSQQVGTKTTTNNQETWEPDSREKQEKEHKIVSKAAKPDPLGMLREIYLDHDSKIVAMLAPTDGEVQKFHPNGRYGRRSVDNFAESRLELAELATEQESVDSHRTPSPLRDFLQREQLRPSGQPKRAAATPQEQQTTNQHRARLSDMLTMRDANWWPSRRDPLGELSERIGSMSAEMNKLLKCKFTGLSHIFWCDSTGGAAGNQS